MEKRLPDVIKRIEQSKEKNGRMLSEVLNRVNRKKEKKMFESIKFNRVLHNQRNSSNKVYIITLEPHITRDPKEIHVVAQWGSVSTINLRKQVKHKCDSLEQADNLAAMLAQEKTKKGYVDIESSSYVGKVTLVNCTRYLVSDIEKQEALNAFSEGDLTFNEAINALSEMSGNINNNTGKHGVFEVKCIDNLGLEEFFEINKTYKASKTNEDDMIEVKDNSGKTHECFTDRFEIV